MIRTYTLDCHAANPQMPLEPVCPYTGSAATFVLVNLPRPHGKQRIDAVTLSITNADAAVSAHPATREGSSWIVTVPAAAIGPAGNVKEAIIISASGVDEQNRPVSSWIVAVADLRVKNQDGTAVPGEPRVLISWFDSRPANPRGVFICPSPEGQAALDLYDGHNYRPLGGGADVLGKLPLRTLPKYLHALSFDDTYPADAAWLYAQLGPSDIGRCSAVRRGGKLWRNYDWTFDSSAEFSVKVSGNVTRFASVGMASVGSRLTENEVASGVYSRYYRCLPGMTLDGINEKGVVCAINVDGGPKTGWHGDVENEGIHILAAVRWVLDHGESAAQAAAWLADHIIQPAGEMNFHFMVADATSTYIVENGAANDVTDGTKVLTNYGVFDSAQAGEGKERYNLLAVGADIKSVWFTNAYHSGNDWDSDFESETQHAEAIRQWAAQGETKEAHRGKTTSSGKAWWQSVHTTEYDFAAKTMKVAVQEQDEWFTFAVDAVPQSIETDDTVARTSANPVKSSGIWQAIWGSLTALPTGFSSLYDWCVSQFSNRYTKAETDVMIAGKVDDSAFQGYISYNDGRVNGVIEQADNAISIALRKADRPTTSPITAGNIATLTSTGDLDDSGVGINPSTKEIYGAYGLASIDFSKWICPDGTFVCEFGSRTVVLPGGEGYDEADPEDKIPTMANISATVLAKIAPAYSSTSAYKIGAKVVYNGTLYSCKYAIPTGGEAWNSAHWDALSDISGVLSGIDKSGKPTDDFAGELLGKQVANAKVRYALATTASAAMADRTVNLYEMNGNGTITFPTATTHEGVTYARDFLLRVKVTTAGSLTLPTDVTPLGDSFDFTKANDWLIAFTEIGKDANNKAEFYIRAISLEG